MTVDLKHELSPDAARVLAYLVGLVRAGRMIRDADELCGAMDPPMTKAQVAAVLVECRRAGLLQPR